MAHKPDPYALIKGIEQQVYDFRRNYTEGDRLILEHLGLVDGASHISTEEHEELLGENSEKLEELEKDRDDLHELVIDIRDQLQCLAEDNCAVSTFLEVVGDITRKIHEADIDLIIDDDQIAGAIVKASMAYTDTLAELEESRKKSNDDQAERSAQPDASPATPDPTPDPEPVATGQLKASRTKHAASGPPVLTRTPKGKALELSFDGIPDEATRAAMKANGFRWSRKRRAWLATYSEDALVFAADLANADPSPLRQAPEASQPDPTPPTPAAAPPEAQPAAPSGRRIPRGFSI